MSFNENKIVIGGTPNPSDNRMMELADELEYMKQDDTEHWYQLINMSDSRLSLIRYLLLMEENNFHIVGSRGFVYRSMDMAREVANFHPLCSNVLTRGLRLRQKCAELYAIEKLEENVYNKLKEEFDIGKL